MLQGMLAMGAVPVREGEKIVAVLNVASDQAGVLDRCAPLQAPHPNSQINTPEDFVTESVSKPTDPARSNIRAGLGSNCATGARQDAVTLSPSTLQLA